MNFSGVYNFHERMVFDEVLKVLAARNMDYTSEEAEDIACLALNKIPSRYVRHSVDTAFYQTSEEFANIHDKVTKSVEEALIYVSKHPGIPD